MDPNLLEISNKVAAIVNSRDAAAIALLYAEVDAIHDHLLDEAAPEKNPRSQLPL